MLTTSELARELGLSRQTVLRLASDGKIPCIKLPTGRGDFRFDLDQVLLALTPKVSE